MEEKIHSDILRPGPQEWKWTGRRIEAARLIAEGEMSLEAIAKKCGVSRPTLDTWRRREPFQERIQQFLSAYCASGFAVVSRRIQKLTRLVVNADRELELLETVKAERAKMYNKPNIPGGATGLVVTEFKGVGGGENFQLIPEHPVDTGLLQAITSMRREQRETLKQAAQDLGQFSEKLEVTGKDGGPIQTALVDLSTETLMTIRAEMEAKAAEKPEEKA